MKTSAHLPNLVLDAIGAGTWDWDIASDTVWNSKAYARILGIAEAEVHRPRHLWQDLLHEADRARVLAALEEAVRNGSPYSERYRIRRDDGSTVWLEDMGRLIESDGAAGAIRMVGAIRDVTEEMQVRSTLQESERRFTEIVESLPGGVVRYRVSPEGVSRYGYISPTCADLFGLTVEEIQADPFAIRSLFSPEDQAVFAEHFVTRRDNPHRFDRLITYVTRGGIRRHVHAVSTPARQEDGSTLWTSVLLDVTHQVELEHELTRSRELFLHSQKLDAVGQLSGGIAHDFNNLLSVIMGNLELIGEEGVSDTQNDYLSEATAAARRGSDLTRSLLSFARKAALKPQRLDLNDVLRNINPMLRRTLPATIDLEMALMGGLWAVEVDRGSAENAVLNLVINARDAMPKGGKLTIETANIRLTDDYVEQRHETVPPGRYVMVAVTDTGTGIPPGILEQVFEPFFTTKEVGRGTGLGLSSALGFSKQSGGTTRIYSEVGVGTSVKMYFRAVPDAADRPPLALQPGSGDLERILLVEDEDAVRRVLRSILEREGFRVLEAATGDEGLQLYLEARPVDLVLTDIVMPGKLMGTAMVKEMRKHDPDLRAIFISGYPNEAAIHGNGLQADDVQMMEPVARLDLLRAIRKVLAT
ncbi:hybrid sensor histidine kinase/response regulator [Oceaniglobus roseus]|uniref:hybrid sensor histidine kinase/response regulator n=1 Tax=Oceaniglobus roseus TaxID=1737570 RepID=UPI000C7F4502|nr:hybrid sensor histidine kinase/response regulator [Kandeliimicrobium roseum]